jgi:hypothetical protein
LTATRHKIKEKIKNSSFIFDCGVRKVKYDELGSLACCLLLAVGMLHLPKIGLYSLEGIFVTSWTCVCVLVAAAFLKNTFWRR